MDIKKPQITNKTRKLLTIVPGFLTLAAIILRTVNLFFFYDASIGYYHHGALLPVLSDVFVFCTAVYIALYSFFISSPGLCIQKSNEQPYYVKGACVLSAVLLLVFSFLIFISDREQTLFAVVAIAAMLGAIFLISNLSSKKDSSPAINLTSSGLVIWLVLLIAISYFDRTVAMNSPNKILLHVACIASAFYFILEARTKCGAPSSAKHIVSLLAAFFGTGLLSVPSIIASLLKDIDAGFINYNIVMFGFFVYFGARYAELLHNLPKESDLADIKEELEAKDTQL